MSWVDVFLCACVHILSKVLGIDFCVYLRLLAAGRCASSCTAGSLLKFNLTPVYRLISQIVHVYLPPKHKSSDIFFSLLI